MAFDAGAIEATLTLNRNPFTAGLAAARKQAADFKRNEIEARIVPSLDKAGLAKIKEQLNRVVGQATVRARLDRDSLTRIRDQINRSVGRINVRAQFDNSSLVAIRERINRSVGTMTVRLRLDRDSLLKLRAQVAATRLVANVRLDVDQSALRGLNSSVSRYSQSIRNATQDTKNFGEAGDRAFKGMDQTVRLLLTLAPLLLPVLGSAVVGVTGLVGGLASAFGIAGAGIGAFALVAKPVFDQVSEGAKKTDAEIRKLPPGISQAAAALKGLTSTYDALVKSTQKGVGTAMAAGFNAAKTAISGLAPLINTVSQALTTIGNSMTVYFNSKHFKDFIDFLRVAMGPILQKVFDIIAYGTRSVMNLVKAFEPLAQWILQGIADGMKEFARWTETLGQNKDFQKFVDLVKESLPKIWGFIQTLIVFIFNLSIALAPIGNLILDVFTKIFNALNMIPPEFLGPIAVGIAAIFAAILLGASGPVGIAIGAILAIAAAFKYVYDSSKTLQDFFSGMIAELKAWFQPFWEKMTDLFNTRVKPAWDNLMKVIKEKFMPVLKELWEKFKTDVLPALQDLGTTIMDKVVPAFLEFMAKVAPVLAWLWENLGKRAIEVLGTLVRIIDGAFKMIAGIFTAFTGLFSGDWDKFWDGLKGIAEGFWTAIAGLFGMSLDDLKAKFKEWDEWISTKWDELWNWVSDRWNDFTTWFTTGWSDTWTQVKDFFQGIAQWFEDRWNAIWQFFENGFNNFSTVWSQTWENFWTIIKNFAQGIWDAIQNAWNVLWTTVQNIWNTVSTIIGNAWNNFWDGVWQTANRIWEAIKTTISTALEVVKSTISSAADQIGIIWRKVANFFREPINWVIRVVINDGILSAWNTVMGWIGAEGLQTTGLGEIPAFAKGGEVPMTATGVRGKDSVLLRAMPGEFVLSTADVAAMGGISGVEGLRRKAHGDPNGHSYHSVFNGDPKQRIPGYADGGAVERAKAFAQAQNGKPYVWGGVGPNGYDCSGFMSAITNVLRGANPYSRLFTTASFGGGPVNGFVNGLSSAFSIGVKQGNPGHMAGTLGGVNVESTGDHVRYGGDAHGADDGQFTGRFSLPEVGGVFASGGGGGSAVVSWWSVLAEKVTALINGVRNKIGGGPFGGVIGDAMKAIPNGLLDKTFDALKDKLSKLMTVIRVAASALNPASFFQIAGKLISGGDVQSQVRAVAERYGWGSGPEWDALSTIIMRESAWDPSAQNPSSSAAGLFQKMQSVHGPVEQTVTGQAEWGLGYIASRYGDPITALNYWNTHGNYKNGGWLMPGAYSHNETYEPEAIFNRPQITAMHEAIRNAGRRGALDDEFVEKIIAALDRGGDGGGVNIGSVTLPYGASVRELSDECFFRTRHANKGRYGRAGG